MSSFDPARKTKLHYSGQSTQTALCHKAGKVCERLEPGK